MPPNGNEVNTVNTVNTVKNSQKTAAFPLAAWMREYAFER